MAYQPQRDPTNVLGRRFGAFFIDYVLGNAIGIAFLAATKSGSYTGAPTNACSRLRVSQGFTGRCIQMGSRVYTWESSRYSLAIVLGLGVVFLNAVILQGITGASVGKMITGIRVVNQQGNVAGIGRAFLRWVFLLVDLGCFIIGLVTVLVTHPHRRVGDMVAGTYVIGTADVGQPVVAPSPPSYAYAGAPAAGGWAPPQPAQSGWGAPPPTQPAQWGAPPPSQQPPPAWGAPPPPAPQQSAWPPPAAPQPAPAPPPPRPEDQAGWAAPQPSQPSQQPQQPYVPPAPPSAPPTESAPPSWGAPPTYPPPPTYPAPPSWGEPPAPTPDPPAAAPPSTEPPAAPPPAPSGESWWDKGVEDTNGDDKES